MTQADKSRSIDFKLKGCKLGDAVVAGEFAISKVAQQDRPEGASGQGQAQPTSIQFNGDQGLLQAKIECIARCAVLLWLEWHITRAMQVFNRCRRNESFFLGSFRMTWLANSA